MALCPFATHKLLPENRYQPSITPYAAIWHSAVDGPGRTSLYGFFNQDEVTLESHFHILWDGTVEQYMDTTVRADANYRANGFWRAGKYVGAISVETEDDGDPNRRKWSPEQVTSSVRLGKWIREVHPQIPAALCPQWDANGFGYHTLFPTMWTNVRGKTCPGTIRIPQFRNEILPAIAGNTQTQEEDMDPAALVVITFNAVMGKNPSMQQIAEGVEAIKANGQLDYVASIANHPDAEAVRAAR